MAALGWLLNLGFAAGKAAEALIFALLGAKKLLGIKVAAEEHFLGVTVDYLIDPALNVQLLIENNFLLVDTTKSYNDAFLGVILGARVGSFFESDF